MPRYRTRINEIANNVLGVCSHDMQFIYLLLGLQFIYLLPGWEGLAGIEGINGNCYGYGSQTQIPNEGASSKNLNKKRPSSNDELTENLMEIMKDIGKKYEETIGHMATFASCFKIELVEAERRMKVFNKLLKI